MRTTRVRRPIAVVSRATLDPSSPVPDGAKFPGQNVPMAKGARRSSEAASWKFINPSPDCETYEPLR
jgi:hypothetical protein